MRNCLGKRQAEAGTLIRSAGIEPSEPAKRLLAPLGGGAGGAGGHPRPDVALARLDADPDFTTRRPVPKRILNEVADRLGKQLAMAEQRYRPRRPVVNQLGRALLGERVVHFG